MFKPMLAAEVDFDKLRYPIMASPKLDGVRAVIINGVVLSRSLKEIPNRHVQKLFSHLEHYDGELIVGSPTSHTCYRDTMSGVMSRDGEPNVLLFAFDHIEKPEDSYSKRIQRVKNFPKGIKLRQPEILSYDHLIEYEEQMLTFGYEGLILRDPSAPYKFGRSTAREGYLLKLKRFTDAEFEVIGFEERMHNGNEATKNELGRTKRSSCKAGKVGRGDLGALVLKGDGFTFNCGAGFTDEERAYLWSIREHGLVGRLAKIKFFQIGMKDAPRHPVFLGWRDEIDL